MQPFIEAWEIDKLVRHNIYAMPILVGMITVVLCAVWIIASKVTRIRTRKREPQEPLN